MTTITVSGKTVEVDEEGYLVNRTDWNEEIGAEMAKIDNCDLTPNHWEVITSCANITTSTRSPRPCAC